MGTISAGTGMRTGRRPAPRWLLWPFIGIGVLLLAGAGFAAWSELEFRRIAAETDGRVVRMLAETSRDSDGRRSTTYRPVFAFTLPDGREVQVEGSVASSPPCCSVGEAVRVRYDPARPQRAAMVGFLDSWLLTLILGGIGAAFSGLGLLGLRFAGRRAEMAAVAAGLPAIPVPLAGLRQEATSAGTRWVVQARWTDPRGGAARLFESEPLPFDPVPQMRRMTTVMVRFDPGVADGPAWMDLGFLQAPAPAPAPPAAVRRG